MTIRSWSLNVFSFALCLTCLGGGLARAQDADAAQAQNDAAQAQEDDGQQAAEDFPKRLWSYLEKVEYRENYSPYPGTEDKFYEGQAPHGALLKVYVNRYVAQDPSDPPAKAIIVKDNLNDQKELQAITVMYRVEGFDPDNNNWYWVKYLPGGEVAQNGGEPVAGKVQSCIECHGSAKGGDYIFTNDDE